MINTDRALKSKSSLDRYLELYSGFCSTKKVSLDLFFDISSRKDMIWLAMFRFREQIDLKGEVLKGNSVLGVLVKEAKRYNAISVVVGVKQQRKLR